MDGRVQELAVFTIGGIVTPAQELMKIAPTGKSVEVEAWVENKDIGFVYPDQIAEIKLKPYEIVRSSIKSKLEAVGSDYALREYVDKLIEKDNIKIERTVND